jgi:hypothetical protein
MEMQCFIQTADSKYISNNYCMLYTYNVLYFSACHANTYILTAISLLQAKLRHDDPLALGAELSAYASFHRHLAVPTFR